MTAGPGAPSLAYMKKRRSISHLLIVVACSAVVSLVIGDSIDLGTQLLGPGPASTAAIVGDLAALLGCTLSVTLGVRFASGRACSV
jgi:hypothetical protein